MLPSNGGTMAELSVQEGAWPAESRWANCTQQHAAVMATKLLLGVFIGWLCRGSLGRSLMGVYLASLLLADFLLGAGLTAAWWLEGRGLHLSATLLSHASAVYAALPLPALILGALDYAATAYSNRTRTCSSSSSSHMTSITHGNHISITPGNHISITHGNHISITRGNRLGGIVSGRGATLLRVVVVAMMWAGAGLSSWLHTDASVLMLEWGVGVRMLVCHVETCPFISLFCLSILLITTATLLTNPTHLPRWARLANHISSLQQQPANQMSSQQQLANHSCRQPWTPPPSYADYIKDYKPPSSYVATTPHHTPPSYVDTTPHQLTPSYVDTTPHQLTSSHVKTPDHHNSPSCKDPPTPQSPEPPTPQSPDPPTPHTPEHTTVTCEKTAILAPPSYDEDRTPHHLTPPSYDEAVGRLLLSPLVAPPPPPPPCPPWVPPSPRCV